ncbi:hypothetical protein Sgly_0331 [Syntrophobotulus glycolicus DSM 8271]|uniref:Uncharacterized protein n=1 Tax=Syntrophobotulus glycolicus (strain DSM 8271 / FlGlyR) TaxID=645991 RepID=F0SXF1_SYNGF|nr:hypothetical protein [Syntrophobotulus glycolicus]ADY54697.1 hypothetical protein Sgly_0331 [Syntrophobotulus glycolicus DSM 8271]
MSEFERLTKIWKDEGYPLSTGASGYYARSETGYPIHGNIVDRLAQYEDLGSPEEVAKLAKAKEEGRLIVLPVPIGGSIYVPFRYQDLDNNIDEGVEELHLSGYCKEGEREFYMTYDDSGTNDIEPCEVYITKEEAEQALKVKGAEQCR